MSATIISEYNDIDLRYTSKAIQIGSQQYLVKKHGNDEPHYLVLGHAIETRVPTSKKALISKLNKAFFNL